MLRRRSFLTGLAVALAAPAIVRPGLLMPVRPSVICAPVWYLESTPSGFDDLREQWTRDYARLDGLWRGMWNGAPGDMGAFNIDDFDVAKERMLMMREAEAWLTQAAREMPA